MIETHVDLPTTLAMALRAVCALLAGVRVILAMAGNAGGLESDLLGRSFVACRARDLRMRAAQGKAGGRVIEGSRFPPLGRVALLAVRPVESLVYIVASMARIAVLWQPGLLGAPNVARFTFYGLVVAR